jgi:hypothetical protein
MPIHRRSLLTVLALAPSAFASAQAASIDELARHHIAFDPY